MKRKERTEILVHCDMTFLKEWSSKLNKYAKFITVEKPSHSLTMVKVRESAQNSLFYLCEVLVSESRVMCEGKIGIGIIQGMDLEKAYCLAVIDAAYNANLSLTKKLDEDLMVEKVKLDLQKQKKKSDVMKTKVDFHTMDLEV